MRQDARKLDHKTLEALRIRGVKQIQSGVSPEEVRRVLGLSRSTVYNWLAQYREHGMDGLKAKKISGRPPKINGKQMKWIYDTIVQKTPLQFRFEFALWTREMIQKIIRDKFGIKLGLSSVSRLLRQLGLTCQRPIFKAWQQNSQQVNNWLKKVFPKIKARAKNEKADIYFADEAGVRSDYHSGTTWAPKGETPVVEATGARFSVNMISAVSPRGDFRFMVVEGSIGAAVFVEFLKRLMTGSKKKIFLIVDGYPAHRSKKAKEFVSSTKGKLELFYLPPYSPELNPDELAWNTLKNGIVGRSTVKSKDELKSKVVSGLRRIQKSPNLVRSFFDHENTKYAA
ncbi:MAG: IS630 family transposase [Pseudobdellovibrio sp.]